jgi:hypothetical protein
MATNKKPRKAYKPKPNYANPLEAFAPIRKFESYLIDLKIKNHAALAALVQGKATKDDMTTLIAFSNMTEALWQRGFGKEEYPDVTVEGRFAALSIIYRYVSHGRFTPTGPEIQALNLMMELHDAQMEICTVRDVTLAIEHARKKIAQKHFVSLPPELKEAA